MAGYFLYSSQMRSVFALVVGRASLERHLLARIHCEYVLDDRLDLRVAQEWPFRQVRNVFADLILIEVEAFVPFVPRLSAMTRHEGERPAAANDLVGAFAVHFHFGQVGAVTQALDALALAVPAMAEGAECRVAKDAQAALDQRRVRLLRDCRGRQQGERQPGQAGKSAN